MDRLNCFNGKKIIVYGSEADFNDCIYQNIDTGMYIREFVYDLDENTNASINIIQLTDFHINRVNKSDTNDAVLYSKQNRANFLPDGMSAMNVLNSLDFADTFDQTVVTGDVLDYLSVGALELMDRLVWQQYPDIMIAPGNHDFVQVVGSGAKEELSFAERKAMLQSVWKHDLDYFSKLIKDKVLCVVMNNASQPQGNGYCYLETQVQKLAEDIKLAREKGYIILIFQHTPISTGDIRYQKTVPLANGILGDNSSVKLELDLYNNSGRVVGGPGEANATTRAVYDLITHNADVIKGIFAGHVHNHYYTEISAQNFDGSKTIIPQHILSGNFYSKGGNAVVIKVNYLDDYSATAAVNSITFDKKSISLDVGDNYRITTNVKSNKILWFTSDNSVATVNYNGRVVGVGEGSATITATNVSGNVSAQCIVNVNNTLKPSILKVQGTHPTHHIGRTFTGLDEGIYVYSVYCNNKSGGSSIPFVKEAPFSITGGDDSKQYPSQSELEFDTSKIGETFYSKEHHKIVITFTAKKGNYYFCGVTGSDDKLPVYYTGFSLKKQGSDKNLFPSEFLGNGLLDFEMYAGNLLHYYGCMPSGSKFALLSPKGEGRFAYPKEFTDFDQFFTSW